MLRIVQHTVPRVGRSYEHFPDGFKLHLLPCTLYRASTFPRRSRERDHFLRRSRKRDHFLRRSRERDHSLRRSRERDEGRGTLDARVWQVLRPGGLPLGVAHLILYEMGFKLKPFWQ